MKTQRFYFTVLLSLTFLTGCNKPPQSDQGGARPSKENNVSTPASASRGAPPFEGGRKTSFQEVTAELDPGGSLFMYLSTDKWLAGLSTNISAFREVLMSLPNAGMPNRMEMEHLFEFVTRLVKNSGVEDISGVGLSAAPVAPGLYRNKLFLHHPPGAGQGFLWSMFGKAPHTLSSQDMLPSTTALAAFADLDLAQLWEVLQKQLTESGIPQAGEVARSFPQMFEKQTEMAWAPLLASLAGEIGIALTLDETHRFSLPIGPGGQIDLPTPALLVAVKVKSDLLYENISAKLRANPNAVTTEESGLKLCSMPLPVPLPIAVKPTVASSGDYFFFATSPDLIRSVQAVRQGKQPGAKSTPEFQDLARHLPKEGNQFVYIAKSFGQTINEVQRQVLEAHGGPAEQTELVHRMLAARTGYGLTIGSHTDTGWHTTSVGNQDSASAVALAPIAVTAVGAGLLLPALAKAKGKAQTINTVTQMKQLGLAARMYSNDHKDKFPNAATWCDDIKEYVGNSKVYKAPNDSGNGNCSFAFNEKLSGMDETKINPQTVLFFESESGWNRSGGPELMLEKPRSPGLYVVGFADGSVQQLSVSRMRSLRWDP